MISDFATGRPFNALERLLWSAATIDDEVAATLGGIGARTVSPLTVLRPGMLRRMLRARRRAAPPIQVPQPRTAGDASAVDEPPFEPATTGGRRDGG